MPNNQITVNSRKYDRKIRKSWQCDLVKRDGDAFVFVGVFDENISHPGLGDIKRGTVSYEYYWLDRWYNIFCFYEPDGTLRNFYCNVNMPPTFVDDVLDYIDLDLDVLVWPDLSYEILDEDEFEENAKKFQYSESVREKALKALAELVNLVEKGNLPRPQEFMEQTR